VEPPEEPLEAVVHPGSCAGFADGAAARLESAIGGIDVIVRHSTAARRDTVQVAKGGHLDRGQAANLLVQAALTDFGEGGALYDEKVRLVPRSGS
jgi:hypothetical protein